MTEKYIRILLIDDLVRDDRNCRRLLGDSYEVVRAGDSEQTREHLERMKSNNELPTVIILDLSLGQDSIGGLELLRELRESYPEIPIVVWTLHALDYLNTALAIGAKAVVQKHIEDEDLEPTVRSLCGL